MSLNNGQYELLMRFLDADMNREEMTAFKTELIASPELQEQLDFERELRDNLTLHPEWATLLQQEPVKEEKMVAPVVPVKTGNRSVVKWLTVGIAASLIIGFAVFWSTRQHPATNKTIAHRNDTGGSPEHQPPTVVKTPVLPPEDSSKSVDFAALYKQYYRKDKVPDEVPIQLVAELGDYQSGNYKSLQHWGFGERGTVDEAERQVAELGRYYKGVSFLETGQPQKAITELQWVIKHAADKELMAKAEWYAALGYLKMGDKKKAVGFFSKINGKLINYELSKQVQNILETLLNQQ